MKKKPVFRLKSAGYVQAAGCRDAIYSVRGNPLSDSDRDNLRRNKFKPLVFLLFAFFVAPAVWASAGVDWLNGIHDFGAFEEEDGNVSCVFQMVNTGTEPIAITAARPTCGCTASSFTKGEIMPGDTAVVNVSYNPTGRPGRFEKKVYVEYSDPELPRTALRITGVVIGSSNTLRNRYPVDAGALKLRSTVVAFGDVPRRGIKSGFFEVYNASSDTLTPQWGNLPPYIRVTSSKPSIPPGEQMAYAVNLVPAESGVYGLLDRTVTLTPRPGDDAANIDIVANIREDFSRLTPGRLQKAPVATISTTSVDFGDIDFDAPSLSRTFAVRNDGQSTLEIRRIYTADPGVTVSCDKTGVKKGKTATVTVTVTPSLLPSELLNARVIVITNDPQNPEQTLRVTGL